MRILFIFIAITFFACSQINTKKTVVNLSGKNLTVIPDSIFEMKDLVYLDLGSSSPTFYPPLSTLVDSNANQITIIPDKIGNLQNLKVLILNSNKLTSLPSAITKLTKLEELDLSLNKDLDIINEVDKLKKLPNLRILKVVDTKLRKDNLTLLSSSLKSDIRIITTVKEYLDSYRK